MATAQTRRADLPEVQVCTLGYAERGKAMNTTDHARIFNAYLSRCSLADLRALVAAQESAHHAGFHLGTNSQARAASECLAACESAVSHMIQHDRDTIERIIG